MTIFDDVSEFGVVPVIVLDNPADAVPLADALIAGGLPIAEITFRTPVAAKAISIIHKNRPEMIVGAGTVLTEKQLDLAAGAGAKFALAPGIDHQVLAQAQKTGLPFAPGVMTPSDIQIALRANCKMVKFFPAVSAGGLDMLKSIAGPYLHTGIGFNPTGGISLENMQEWLSFSPVKAVGGSWIAKRSDIAAQKWDQITENAKKAVQQTQAEPI